MMLKTPMEEIGLMDPIKEFMPKFVKMKVLHALPDKGTVVENFVNILNEQTKEADNVVKRYSDAIIYQHVFGTGKGNRLFNFHFVGYLAKNLDTFCSVFTSRLLSLMRNEAKRAQTKSQLKFLKEILKWIILVGMSSTKVNRLTTSFSHLLALVITMFDHSKHEIFLRSKMKRLSEYLYRQDLQDQYKQIIFDVNDLENLIPISYLFYYGNRFDIEVMFGKKTPENKAFVNTLLVNLLMSKKPFSQAHLNKFTSFMVNPMEFYFDFNDKIFPSAKKAMLRSPEVAIRVFASIIVGMDQKPTQMLEIATLFANNLTSQNDGIREDAKNALVGLTNSLLTCLPNVISYLFELYCGKNGKLTLAQTKINIFLALAEIGTGLVVYKGNKEDLSNTVIRKCIGFVESENQETVVVSMFEAIGCWGKFLEDGIVLDYTDYIIKGLKNTKQDARVAYVESLMKLSPYIQFTAIKGIETELLQTLDKAEKQLPNSFVETTCLSNIILIAKENFGLFPAVSPHEIMMKIINSCDLKCIENILPRGVKIIGISMIKFLSDLNSQPAAALFRVLPYILLHKSKEVRDYMTHPIRNWMANMDNGKKIFATKTLSKLMARHYLKYCAENEELWKETLRGEMSKLIENVLRSEPEDSILTQLCGAIIEPCQLISDSYWRSQCLFLENDPSTVAETLQDEFFHYNDNFVEENEVLEEKMIISLCNSSRIFFDRLMDRAKGIYQNKIIRVVTPQEYFVYSTPEGQLSDTTVLDTGEGDASKNLKRESKVYTYKEQLEEIQLRKELEEKKKKDGKVVPLTQKQKEAMKAQLEKESIKRKEIAKIVELNELWGRLVLIGFNSGSNLFGMEICQNFAQRIIARMDCCAAGKTAVDLYNKIVDKYFTFDYKLVQQLKCLTYRMFKPQCEVDYGYEKESLDEAIENFLTLVKVELVDNIVKYTSFCVLFPLLQSIGFKYNKTSILEHIMTIIQKYLLNRRLSDDFAVFLDPSFLPRDAIASLLFHILGKTDGRYQHLCVTVLHELAKSTVHPMLDLSIATDDEASHYITALENTESLIRKTGIECLLIIQMGFENFGDGTLKRAKMNIFRVGFDEKIEIARLAKKLWSEINNDYDFDDLLITNLDSSDIAVRTTSAKALAEILRIEKDAEAIQRYAKLYQVQYVNFLEMTQPVFDSFGRVAQEGVDRWEARHGMAMAFKEMIPLFDSKLAYETLDWMLATSLGDKKKEVNGMMLEACMNLINKHGKENMGRFLCSIEAALEEAARNVSNDQVRQACVVLMGSLAQHMDQTDDRVRSIFWTLIETLAVPSELVQQSVAFCLIPIAHSVWDDGEKIFNHFYGIMKTVESYGERRGACFGLAAMVKGLGILSLKRFEVMNFLSQGMQDKKNNRYRESTLMALEIMCEILGRLFEPYVVNVLPYLLNCLGDPNQYVREATDAAARCLMKQLSSHGVKLVLPSLLCALDEDSWRTKCGSIDLLGSMAYCAPKQLSGCLPMIVPRLIEVIGDSHVRVQDSAAKALGMIGSVIKNPEIQSVVPVLLEALQDPAKKTTICLHALLQTEFVHFVDSPSLALIMPVVQRAFQDRATENRKMASQIIGNMYSLADQSDLIPYMDKVMPGLQTSLLDPVPEVRAVAAKALGAMGRSLGDKSYDELLPWLMKTLISEANAVDRSGAAQGLAEVIGALGEDKLHRFMPEIIRKADSDDLAPHVRDGYMMMLIYMPSVFEGAFVPYIGQIITPILKALADENEFVRDTALRAGQRIVTGFADSAVALLLPELEKGIFSENWRIRYSSIQLLGDLMYKISGVSGKMSTESSSDDDNFGTEQSQKAIVETLGYERRNRVLSGLYMVRSDVALMVRQAALHVWKVVVANTPKTLREILPMLFSILLGCLASNSHDKRQVAARTLGDLVRKLGEKILPEIIPILEKGLESKKADERQGVCIGLSEIMASTSREMVLAFVENLVPTLRRALCDVAPKVREAAAHTFGSLHNTVGSRAVDEILPYIMKKLDDPYEGEYALDGLGQILTVKSKGVMPYLVPQLTSVPVNTKALSVLASVAAEALAKHLGKVIPALIQVIAQPGDENIQDIHAHCDIVVLSIVEENGVRILVDELLKKRIDMDERKAAVRLLSVFCVHTKADLSNIVPHLIRGLILLFVETDDQLLNQASDALAAVIKTLTPAEMLNKLEDVRQAVRFAQGDLKGKETLPGICIAKGIKPMLPIFREALLNGLADVKEQAALGLGELINLSSPESLKQSVIHVTGPLIRILGDRYTSSLKMAVLDTLTFMLFKVGTHMRGFLPQLQTTFYRALQDAHRGVRLRGAHGLAKLVEIHAKPDGIFIDVIASIKSSEDTQIRDSVIYSLRCLTVSAGEKIDEQNRRNIITFATSIMNSAVNEDSSRVLAAGNLGAMFKHMSPYEIDSNFTYIITDESDSGLKLAKTSALAVALKEAPKNLLHDEKKITKLEKTIVNLLTSDKPQLVANGVRASASIFLYCIQNNLGLPKILVPFSKSINNSCNEVKALFGQVCEVISRRIYPELIPKELLKYLIPSLVNGTKEKNSVVRASCEIALISILHLRDKGDSLEKCLSLLESGAQEALTDVISKVLRKLSIQIGGKEPETDDTILS